jgi:hypothetical protein
MELIANFVYVHLCLLFFLPKSVMKQGDGLSPWLFNFVLYLDFRKVKANQQISKVNGTRHLMFYTNVAVLMSENVMKIKPQKWYCS